MIKYYSYKKLIAIQKKIRTKTIRTKPNILSISRVKTKCTVTVIAFAYFTKKNP